MLNKQEVFDKVARHLLTQNRRSIATPIYENSRCSYRGDNKTKCAIGCLIEDKFYDKDFEGATVAVAAVKRALEMSGIFIDSYDYVLEIGFLENLQQIHDNELVENWLKHLNRVAISYNLDDSVLKEFENK